MLVADVNEIAMMRGKYMVFFMHTVLVMYIFLYGHNQLSYASRGVLAVGLVNPYVFSRLYPGGKQGLPSLLMMNRNCCFRKKGYNSWYCYQKVYVYCYHKNSPAVAEKKVSF